MDDNVDRRQEASPMWKSIRIPTQLATLFGAVIGAVFAVAAYEGVASPNDRFLQIERRVSVLEHDATDIKTSLARIEQKQEDTLQWLRKEH